MLSMIALAGYIVSTEGFAGYPISPLVLFSSLMLLGQCGVEMASIKF